MVTRGGHYRQRAAGCEVLAKHTTDERIKQQFLHAAEEWRMLAEKADALDSPSDLDQK